MRKSVLWRTAVGTLLAGGVVAVAGWVVFLSPVLGVREVAVIGNERLPAEQIRRAAAVPPDTPLVGVDTEEVRARVAALREVESATVDREWPGTLLISVVERLPLAAVPINGKVTVVDRFGVVLDVVDPVEVISYRLPELRTHRYDPADPGIRAALAVLATLPESLSRRVKQVTAASAETVTLTLADGRTVVWGGPERTGDKSRILTALLRENAMTLDVSSPDVVTVK
ncbi:hypothetical protein Aph01nite_14830 [Acrocarpospora phusangensis]|uniref:POTRA domain-containing protein n=1 Tax=Acrocarpospora phusangensis TaxID=1070424 RepID=A0A919Q973_9ACTN|nr:FtsQ-type POTRA domain-containing protein [Acrocarpospora phusangensis]GIH23173.1 hypothetical protein Aph01nite_14830 [Acrocarpospora phusangensis]